MELKSPLTVRQGSAIPFEQQQPQAIQYSVNDQPPTPTPQPIIMSQSQTPLPGYTNGTINHRQLIDNPYNNRGILKSNGMPNNQGVGYPVAIQQQPIPAPTRNVFLNRAYSETPRVGYTNGYETDSGLPNYNYKPSSNPFNTTTRMYNTITTNNRGDIIDQESTGVINNFNNSYRTLGPSTSARYNIINDQSGYDTDTGLMKLRHVLDNNRRTSSRNNMPINQPNGYYYNNTNRSMTPLFNYQTSQQQPSIKLINQDVRYNSLTPDPLGNSQYSVGSYPVVDNNGISFINGNNAVDFVQPQQQPQINTIQYIDSNGNITAGIPALVTADGNQIIIQELDPNMVKYTPNLNQSMLTSPSPVPSSVTSQAQPTSLIIHQQVAPSAYNSNTLTKSASSTNNTLLKNNATSNNIKAEPIQNSASLNQLNNNGNGVVANKETPTRLGISTSATNLAQQKQKQLNSSISQQLNNSNNNNSGNDSRRASASSLSG
jgi:hypothetical protein